MPLKYDCFLTPRPQSVIIYQSNDWNSFLYVLCMCGNRGLIHILLYPLVYIIWIFPLCSTHFHHLYFRWTSSCSSRVLTTLVDVLDPWSIFYAIRIVNWRWFQGCHWLSSEVKPSSLVCRYLRILQKVEKVNNDLSLVDLLRNRYTFYIYVQHIYTQSIIENKWVHDEHDEKQLVAII